MIEKRTTMAGRKMIKAGHSLINFIVLVVIVLLVVLSLYALWDSDQVFREADAQRYEVYKPTTEDSLSFDELKDINPEVFSWLTVYGTHIDYPVVQSTNNAKYVNINAFGEYSLSGAIFLDCANDKSFSDFNSILYGHHMEKQAMFGELGSFSNKTYFESHRYGNLYFDGKDHGLEFFAFIEADAYDTDIFTANIQGRDIQQEYLNQLFEKALHVRDVPVSIDDRIVILSTCSSETTNGRSILVAKIHDRTFSDTFNTLSVDDVEQGEQVDAQGGFLQSVPLWAWFALPALILIVIVIVIRERQERRKR